MVDERSEILAVLDRYATALDRRDWALLEQVFTEDLVFAAESVDHHEQTVLIEPLEQWAGLRFVQLEPLGDGFGGVIFPGRFFRIRAQHFPK